MEDFQGSETTLDDPIMVYRYQAFVQVLTMSTTKNEP